MEGSIGESRSNSMSEEGSEKKIVESDEEVGCEENFEQNKEDNNQGNARMSNDVVHGHGVGRRNKNIVGICWFEW